MNHRSPVKTFFRIGAVAAVFFLFAWGGYNRGYGAFVAYREKNARDEAIRALEERSSVLGGEIQKLDNTEAIEREAKERFNLKREGETVVVIVSDDSLDNAAGSERASFWVRIRNALKIFFK